MNNEFMKRRARKIVSDSHSDYTQVLTEVAQDFGKKMAMAVNAGVPPELAVEATKEHFKIYGKAMIEFADLSTEIIQMTPDGKMIPKEPVG